MRPPEEIKDLLKESKVSISSEKNSKILNAALLVYERTQKERSALSEPTIWRITLRTKAGCLVAIFLIISSWAVCFVLSRKLADLRDELAQRDVAIARTDDSVTINLYLREHQDAVARYTSLTQAVPRPLQMRVSQDDILYYEFLDDELEYMHPGIIVRGTPSQREIGSPEAPVISNGHTLTLPEAREAVDFELRSPARLHPGYELDQIIRINGRDTLHLLYTDRINSVSLFEQSLDGQHGLSRQDFREYAVYRNKERSGGTILAWRDDVLSYVLIGNTDMSQLMDMAQSIGAGR